MIWHQYINVDTIFEVSSQITSLTLAENGDVIAAGNTSEIGAPNRPFAIRISPEGDIVWKTQFKESAINSLNFSGLDATQDGGFIWAGTHFDDLNDEEISYLVKMDENGFTSCEDTLAVLVTILDTLPSINVEYLVEAIDTLTLNSDLNCTK